ncbi:MAG: ABC transporter ATP-binding protein, partial [Magnetococcales bacterium]|nr:ABC transporter ATP-binding protein [Magnetococcales bacterium]
HGQEARWQGRFDEQLGILYNAHANHTNMQSVFSPLMLFSGAVSGLFILGYGGRQVAEGTLTVGDFVAFTGYLALLIWPTIGLGWILTVMQRGLAALDRLHMVLSLPVVHRQEEGVEETERWRGEIQVKDLTFAYGGSEQPVLKNLSLSVAPGAFVGLVGRVGCGKSALLNCLANLYPVPAGTVFLDGREINTIPEAVLRHNLTMAPQESFLFSIPVVENLLYGREESTEEEGWRLAEQVSLAEEIKIFPKGMQTLVGERGITLSGGQRQRVALARALAMHTPIVLLDDIFSSVDARTEAAILQHLFHGQSSRPTVVMVCHRVAALHQAEVIHVMEEGRIVASGTHQQLLTQSPLYGELHQRMARAEALESLQ